MSPRRAARRRHGLALVAGLLFALGLGLAGMTNSNKVLAFFDLAGDWDPSLAFVMLGAILVYMPAYRRLRRRDAPLWAERLDLPTRTDVDRRLLLGALLFGAGWGLAGYCPGPALVASVSLEPGLLAFLAAMALGMLAKGALLDGRGARLAGGSPPP